MKTYIFTKTFYMRDSKGYYNVMTSEIKGVFASKEKAIERAEKLTKESVETWGGVRQERSLFDSEVFNQSVTEGENKFAFIVTENEVIA